MSEMRSLRLLDVDRAKGLAILLVVVGHIVATTPPPGNDWYVVLHETIYQFHMPFFMFLSGLLMGHTFVVPRSVADYRDYILKRFIRLFPAYVLFGLLILVGKLIAGDVVAVDNAPDGFAHGLMQIAVRPFTSAARSLWYIYVLFGYCVLIPPLLTLTRNRLGLLILCASVFHFWAPTDLFMLNGIIEYSIYFTLGLLAARHYVQYVAALDTHRVLLVSAFGCMVAAYAIGLVTWPDLVVGSVLGLPTLTITKLILGCAAIPALHALVRAPGFAASQSLLTLGVYTFAIYLMNTIAIGVVKGAMLRVWSWDGTAFLAFAPILVVAGTLLPILVKRFLFSKIRSLDRITG
jgi:fucose 4-O-acetylase-like acetyltransferase